MKIRNISFTLLMASIMIGCGSKSDSSAEGGDSANAAFVNADIQKTQELLQKDAMELSELNAVEQVVTEEVMLTGYVLVDPYSDSRTWKLAPTADAEYSTTYSTFQFYLDSKDVSAEVKNGEYVKITGNTIMTYTPQNSSDNVQLFCYINSIEPADKANNNPVADILDIDYKKQMAVEDYKKVFVKHFESLSKNKTMTITGILSTIYPKMNADGTVESIKLTIRDEKDYNTNTEVHLKNGSMSLEDVKKLAETKIKVEFIYTSEGKIDGVIK